MKYQRQLVMHNPDGDAYGDCYRTCVAVLLGLDAERVPHVYHDGAASDVAERRMRRWLAQYALRFAEVLYPGELDARDVLRAASAQNPGLPFILTGESAIGVGHCVVCLDGAVWCDPSGNDIVGPSGGYYWVQFLCLDISNDGGTSALTERLISLISCVQSNTGDDP